MHDSYFLFSVPNLLMQLPVAVVVIGGLFVAVSRWKRHPTISARATAGLCAFFLSGPGSRLLLLGVQAWAADARSMLGMVAVVGVLTNLTVAVGIGLLVSAAFTGRSAPVEEGGQKPEPSR